MMYLRIVTLLLLGIVGCSSGGGCSDDSSTPNETGPITVLNPNSPLGLLTDDDFRTAHEKVQDALWDRDLLKWADELNAGLDSADVEQLCISLEVFTRACQPERINQTLRRLGKCRIEYQLDPYLTERIGKREFWDSLRVFYASLPIMPDHSGGTAVPMHLVKTQSREAARRWLEKQMNKPWLPMHPDKMLWRGMNGSGNAAWRRAYMDMIAYWGEMPEELTRLEKAIRNHPEDVQLASWYLYGREKLPGKQRPSVAWLRQVLKCTDAILCWQLGRSLDHGDRTPEDEARVAAWLYEKVLHIPLSQQQKETLGQIALCSKRIDPKEAQAVLTRWIKAGLPKLYVCSNQLEKAQTLVEELTGNKDGTLRDVEGMQYRDAGMTQRRSGQRVVEGRIKKAEAIGKDSVGYWLKRANYYAGRRESKEQEKAYLAALALPDNPDEYTVTMRGNNIPRRFEAVRAYCWFLEKQKRFGALETFYRKEIQREGIDSRHYKKLIRIIGRKGTRCTWDDPMIWAAVAKRKELGELAGAYELVSLLADVDPGPNWRVREVKLIECLGKTPPPELLWSLAETLYRRWYEYNRLDDATRVRTPEPVRTTRSKAIDMMLEAYKALPDTPTSDKMSKRVSLIRYLFLSKRPKEAIAFVEQIKAENNGRLPALAQRHWSDQGAEEWIRWALASGEDELAMEWLRTAANFDLAGGYTRMGGYRGPITEDAKTFYRDLLKRSAGNSVILGIMKSVEQIQSIRKGRH
jgi:hypothetical protein